MRVIAGKARRLQLKAMEGMNTRPTTDRIKETLFNMLSFDIENSRFLDLYSGSGAIGIEALSRGAKEAYFVENNRQAIQCIKDNLNHTKLAQDAVVIGRDVLTAIAQLNTKREPFDIIFMDPPYGKLHEKEALFALSDSSLCDEDTIIIVESDLETDFSYVEDTSFYIIKEKIYKTNKHTFFALKKEDE
ncbi:MAG: 16S rRNA (guanine(966)-N(2))-methyltransferase RsmD [Eubacteriales bacterium]|nr:16S rRNA (guanine(966)-N(2))-methyltransferase RsmD [Eubacteriales bacterium]